VDSGTVNPTEAKQILLKDISGIDVALRLRFVDAVLGDDLALKSKDDLVTHAEAVFGVTGFTSVISKILMKHHLNVHHSNNALYVGMNCVNHSGKAIIV
jgi:hypothetical protein